MLARDLRIGGERWAKGGRLSAADLDALATADPAAVGVDVVTVIVPEEGDLHEDDAALRLAAAVAGPGLEQRGPNESRVDLVAAVDGVLHVRVREVELLDRIDPLEVFTALDGSVVRAGQLVGSVKVAPHVVPGSVVDAGVRITRDGRKPLVWVAPFVAMRVGVLVKESLRAADRERFERSVRDKVESLGSRIVRFEYVADADEPVEAALASLTRGPDAVDVVLTAGGRSTDPGDPFFVALPRVRGRLVRRGVPGAPGLDALAGPGRARRGPRAADVRRLFEGDGRRPAAAAAAHRVSRRRFARSPGSATAASSPVTCASASRPTPASSTRRTAEDGPHAGCPRGAWGYPPSRTVTTRPERALTETAERVPSCPAGPPRSRRRCPRR